MNDTILELTRDMIISGDLERSHDAEVSDVMSELAIDYWPGANVITVVGE